MSRYLFVILPIAGHINAPLAVADVLRARGHDIAWCGPQTFLRPLVGPTATVYPTGTRFYPDQIDHGAAAVRPLWSSYLVPLARFTLAALERAVADYRPDLLVVDQHALAGALVAYRDGLPFATLAPGLIELVGTYAGPEREFVDGQLTPLAELAGLPADRAADLLFSPRLTVAFTSSALTAGVRLPDTCVLVGPALGHGPAHPAFPWEWLDPGRQHVLVTVGTLADLVALDFVTQVLAAVHDLGDRLQVVLVAAPGVVPDVPDHVFVAARVPTLAMMPRLDAVVCHGGMGIVGEALATGVPLVIAPIRYDQPFLADQVAAAGAGVRVRFSGASPVELRAAITAVLADPSYRDGAARVGASFAAAGGAGAAATALERLLTRCGASDQSDVVTTGNGDG